LSCQLRLSFVGLPLAIDFSYDWWKRIWVAHAHELRTRHATGTRKARRTTSGEATSIALLWISGALKCLAMQGRFKVTSRSKEKEAADARATALKAMPRVGKEAASTRADDMARDGSGRSRSPRTRRIARDSVPSRRQGNAEENAQRAASGEAAFLVLLWACLPRLRPRDEGEELALGAEVSSCCKAVEPREGVM
jgi:hypothetical protein